MKPRNVCVLALFGLAACVMPVAPATEPQVAGEPSAGGGLSCTEAFDCYGACTDDACYASCEAATDPSAAPLVASLYDCTINVCQTEASCVSTSCSAQIDACRGAQGQPAVASADVPGQPHPNAGLLAWMTGDWIGTNHQFQFFGDGTVRRSSGVPLYTDQGSYACVSVVNDIGAVRQEGDLFIMTFDTTDENHCGEQTSRAPVTVRYRIEWFDNVYDEDPYLQLHLRELDCTRGGDMYCVDAMRRR